MHTVQCTCIFNFSLTFFLLPDRSLGEWYSTITSMTWLTNAEWRVTLETIAHAFTVINDQWKLTFLNLVVLIWAMGQGSQQCKMLNKTRNQQHLSPIVCVCAFFKCHSSAATWVACGKSPFLLFATPAIIFSLVYWECLWGRRKIFTVAHYSLPWCASQKKKCKSVLLTQAVVLLFAHSSGRW